MMDTKPNLKQDSSTYPPSTATDVEKAPSTMNVDASDVPKTNHPPTRIVKLERLLYASLVLGIAAFIAAMVNLGFMSAFMSVSFSLFTLTTNTVFLVQSHRSTPDNNNNNIIPFLVRKRVIGITFFNALLWLLNTGLTGWLVSASRSPDFGQGPWTDLRLVPGIVEVVFEAILAGVLWTLAISCVVERKRVLRG